MNILPEELSISIGSDLNQYYRGRVCTILVSSLAEFQKPNTPEEATQSFTGVVNTITKQGVCITDLIDKTKNFFFFSHIVGIREEKVLDPNNPDHQQEISLVEEAMKMKESKKEPKKEPSLDKEDSFKDLKKQDENVFVDLKNLQNLAKESKHNLLGPQGIFKQN